MELKDCRLTVLTPTYNRRGELPALAESLAAQTRKGFQWLIVDDGSADGTGDYVKSLRLEGIQIDYCYKLNGGKHTALNYAHPYLRGEYVCIVDSDDQLVPQAVELIYEAVETYGGDGSIACFSFQKGDPSGRPLVRGMPEKPLVSDHISFRLNGRRFGDCAEVVRSSVLREFPFPEFPGERFLSEGYLWVHIGKKYRTVYDSRVIYLCDYRDGGLTKGGRGMRMKSPLGGMAVCNVFLSARKAPRLCLRLTVKQIWLYICYGKYAGLSYSKMRKSCERPWLMTVNYPAGLLMYGLFRRKYR